MYQKAEQRQAKLVHGKVEKREWKEEQRRQGVCDGGEGELACTKIEE